ncbi:MAG: hypothetical protein Q9174_003846 [Haloplaca sp. 1 TL-2023]
MQTVATLHRMPPTTLSSLLSKVQTSSPPSSLAIIDVRDGDHAGGHIKSSQHVPSSTLDYRIPELVRTLKEKDIVVFHCSLSQQRGPGAALRYLRERERLVGDAMGASKGDDKLGVEKKVAEEGLGEEKMKDIAGSRGAQTVAEGAGSGSTEGHGGKEQEVYVLDGGFVKWQELYVETNVSGVALS